MRLKIIKCGGVNCYLLSDGGSSVLIDTATFKYREKLYEICKRENVRLVVLTHGHPDHTGNAAFLAKELNIPSAIGEGDEELVFGRPGEIKRGLMGKLSGLISGAGAETVIQPVFLPAYILSEGDSLKDFGINADIIALPGHTKGSIGIKAGSRLFIGDALVNIFKPALSGICENRADAQKAPKGYVCSAVIKYISATESRWKAGSWKILNSNVIRVPGFIGDSGVEKSFGTFSSLN